MNKILEVVDEKIEKEEKLKENKEMVKKSKNFETGDLIYYIEDLERNRPYLLLNTCESALLKTEDGWKAGYVYSGEDKKTGKMKIFIREKEDFENKFFKLS